MSGLGPPGSKTTTIDLGFIPNGTYDDPSVSLGTLGFGSYDFIGTTGLGDVFAAGTIDFAFALSDPAAVFTNNEENAELFVTQAAPYFAPLDYNGLNYYYSVYSWGGSGYYIPYPAGSYGDLFIADVPANEAGDTIFDFSFQILIDPYLFSSINDVVNYNALTPEQILAISAAGADQDGLGGNDTITLPTLAAGADLAGTGVTYDFAEGMGLGDGESVVYGSDAPTVLELSGGESVATLIYQNVEATVTFFPDANTTLIMDADADAKDMQVQATIVDFAYSSAINANSNTIDIANQADLNLQPVTGTSNVVDLYQGATLAIVLTFRFESWVLPFQLSELTTSGDGKGGTDIAIGVGPPTLATLADLANATYAQASYAATDNGTVVDGYTIEAGTSDSSAAGLLPGGLLADAFVSGNQVVVAIRGTFSSVSWQLGKNLVADASWAAGALGLPGGDPDSVLQKEVLEASAFLYQVRQQFPDDEFSITGHSLGGAVAQLLGEASGFLAVGFNAPGTAQFLTPLTNAGDLTLAAVAGPDSKALDDNFRMDGDQVSLAGDPLGQQWTIPSIYQDTWGNAPVNHFMDTVVAAIDNPQTPVTYVSGATSGVPDAKLPLADLIEPVTTRLAQAVDVLGFTFTVTLLAAVGVTVAALAAAITYLDPEGGYDNQLVADSSAPAFSGFLLPGEDGVASYSVRLLVGGDWQAVETVAPGDILATPADTTGIDYEAEDSDGDAVALPEGDVIGAAFDATGTFTGTLTETIACFAAGTRIATARGLVPVEALRVGDLLHTASGGLRPLIWLGHRDVDCRRHKRPHDVRPVRIAAHAFAAGQPAHDLLLSPDHAVLVGAELIPIRHLIDGVAIALAHIDRVTYWHAELDRHDVILAEGLPCESFLDTGNRAAFENGSIVVQMHPDFAQRLWDAEACAPIIVAGPQLDQVRAKLNERLLTLAAPGRATKRRQSARRERPSRLRVKAG